MPATRQTSNDYDVIIIGAGAAGLFCAQTAGARGRSVLVIDHAPKIGEKIRISGGGRCNFTNIRTRPENFLSQNPKFCVSALARFTPQDFISHVDQAKIAWHEKKLGQLFCDESSVQIIDMLLAACRREKVAIKIDTVVENIEKKPEHFVLKTKDGSYRCASLVIATGGKSIPKIGATGFGYQIAEQFDINVIETRPGLVPLNFSGDIKEMTAKLSGVSVEAKLSTGKRKNQTSFQEGLLFTHRGLSGPSVLQISNYWREGEVINLDLLPGQDVYNWLLSKKRETGGVKIDSLLSEVLPKSLSVSLASLHGWAGHIGDWSDKKLRGLREHLQNWQIVPVGSEGYRTAEVTLGGIDTKALDSKSMMVKSVPGLYFVGEVLDVTGWLGGYNFQWAWASAHAAGTHI